MINIDTELNKLKKIRPVSAPPFLLTRIEQRIAASSISAASPKLRLAVFSTLVVLALVNVLAVSSQNSSRSPESDIRMLASEMNVSSSNELYE